MAILGGIAASQGAVRTPVDTILGALINGGLTYGIASLYISQKSKTTKSSSATNDTQREFTMTPNLINSNIPDELKDFLQTLEIVPGRNNGWYKDPSNLYKLRYFYKGKWTLAVSDSESEAEKQESLAKHLKTSLSTETPISSPTINTHVASNSNPTSLLKEPTAMNQRIEQLERIAELRQNNMISDLEYEKLKSEILSNL
jgi:hypothetical protein